MSALCFLCALILLVTNKIGILSVPGLIIAVLAIYFSLQKKHLYAACLGVLTAMGSFTAQFVTVFCLSCTLAATAFLLGGLLSLLLSRSEKMIFNLGIILVAVISLILMILNLPRYEQRPIITQSVVSYEQSQEKEKMEESKVKLYISPGCKSCKTVIDQFIQEDAEGEYWQPVVVPPILLAQGESLLRDKGYKGEIISAFDSPTKFVPVMQYKDQTFAENQITFSNVKTLTK